MTAVGLSAEAAATMPNFLVIGAARSGTTSLYHYLRQHPDVFVSPVKEPRFFAFEGAPSEYRGPGDDRLENGLAVWRMGDYQRLFRGVSGEKAIGEASTIYLNHPRAAERIHRHLPDVRLIAMLRDPAERAYSAYLLMMRDGREHIPDFARALNAEEARLGRQWSHMWGYRQRGFYGAQIKRYLERFGRDQLRVYLYDDFCVDPLAVVSDCFSFLGVDPSFVPDLSRRHNSSGVPRHRRLYDLLMRLQRVLPRQAADQVAGRLRGLLLARPSFPAAVRQQLVEGYREDVLDLQGLLGLDLSRWLR